MSQHIFTTTGHTKAPIEVIVGLEARKRGFFMQIYGKNQEAPFEAKDGLADVTDVERALRQKGVCLNDKVAEALEEELKELDSIGPNKINRRVVFYPAH